MNQAEIKKFLQDVPWELLSAEYNGRVARNRTPTGAGGRKKVMRPCPKCSKEFGTRELAAHTPKCEGKGRREALSGLAGTPAIRDGPLGSRLPVGCW